MNIDQKETGLATAWNDVAGHAWVDLQAVLDRLFAPFEAMLVDGAVARGARRILDVSCGTGATTLAMARTIGAAGHCTGIDISAPMIAAARDRADREGANATFLCADAQSHDFADTGFDRIVSRFGVMFFDDSVRAFANLRRAAADKARLHCIVWRGAEDNPFMTTAERAAAPLLPNLPVRQPDEPGQFAFAEPARVQHMLETSGWRDIVIRPIDADCALPERELVHYFTRLGPLGRALPEADEQTRNRAITAVRAAFEPYVQGDAVHFNAACWSVEARAT